MEEEKKKEPADLLDKLDAATLENLSGTFPMDPTSVMTAATLTVRQAENYNAQLKGQLLEALQLEERQRLLLEEQAHTISQQKYQLEELFYQLTEERKQMVAQPKTQAQDKDNDEPNPAGVAFLHQRQLSKNKLLNELATLNEKYLSLLENKSTRTSSGTGFTVHES